jgi:hypothetical protein
MFEFEMFTFTIVVFLKRVIFEGEFTRLFFTLGCAG